MYKLFLGLLFMAIPALSHADGVDTWNSTVAMNQQRAGEGIASYNGYIYAIAGYNTWPTNTVSYTQPQSNGKVPSWSAGSTIPHKLYGVAATASNGYLYSMGGGHYDIGFESDLVYFSKIGDQGAPGPWMTTSPLSTKISYGRAYVQDGYIYVVGGSWRPTYSGGVDKSVPNVQVAAIRPNGSVGPWAQTTGLPAGGFGLGHKDGYLYAALGDPGNWSGEVVYARIEGPGKVGDWKSTTSLPTFGNGSVFQGGGAAVGNGMLFLVGGMNKLQHGVVYSNDVYYATINDNGSLAAWQQTANIGSPISRPGVVSIDGYLYSVGGFYLQGTSVKDSNGVQFAKLRGPRVDSFSVNNSGDTLTINGSGFSSVPAENTVILRLWTGTASITPTTATTTQLTAALGSYRGTSYVEVKTNGIIGKRSNGFLRMLANTADCQNAGLDGATIANQWTRCWFPKDFVDASENWTILRGTSPDIYVGQNGNNNVTIGGAIVSDDLINVNSGSTLTFTSGGKLINNDLLQIHGTVSFKAGSTLTNTDRVTNDGTLQNCTGATLTGVTGTTPTTSGC